jgi:drug/metabolite transporter (DMT)-like permease
MERKKAVGLLSAFTSAVAMGTLGFFVKHVTSNTYLITFTRFLLGLLLLLLIILLSGRLKLLAFKFNIPLVLSGIIGPLAILCYVESIKTSTLSISVVLLYIAPLLATIWSSLYDFNKKIRKEKPKLINFVFILLGLLGILFIGEFDTSLIVTHPSYLIFGLLAGLLFSFHIFFNRIIPRAISGMNRSFYQLFIGLLIVIPFLFIGNNGFSVPDIPYLFLIGVINGFIGITLLIIALSKAEVFEVSPLLYFEPMTAVLIGVLIFFERLSFIKIIGIILILGCGILQSILVLKQSTTNKKRTIG